MQAGKLNRRVLIQYLGDGQDEIGQPVQTWINLVPAGDGRIWANVRFQTGSESNRADQPVSVAKASIRIRRRTDIVAITAKMRAVLDGTIFDIRAVLPDEESRERLDLACETGANNG